MSFIGQQPLKLNEKVQISSSPNTIIENKEINEKKFQVIKTKNNQNWNLIFKLDKEEQSIEIQKNFSIIITQENGDQILYIRPTKKLSKKLKPLWGTLQKKLTNLKISLIDKHTIHLILSGIGYRVEKSNNNLRLKLGFSHNIEVTIPENIDAEITGNDQELILTSKDKEHLSHFSTQIRILRPPEPYKGKGIIIKEKQHLIIRKEGKRRTN